MSRISGFLHRAAEVAKSLEGGSAWVQKILQALANHEERITALENAVRAKTPRRQPVAKD